MVKIYNIELLAPQAAGLYSFTPILAGLDSFRKDNELMFTNMDASARESKLDTIVVTGNLAYNHGSYHYIAKTQSGSSNLLIFPLSFIFLLLYLILCFLMC